jgi:hypothetical protein
MAEPRAQRRQKAICAICSEPIGEGEGIRRFVIPGGVDVVPTHPKCFERDWETIESGFEHFPRLRPT